MPIDLFTSAEDATLLALYQVFGRKWTEIAACIGNGRTTHQVEFRINTLLMIQMNRAHDVALVQQASALGGARLD